MDNYQKSDIPQKTFGIYTNPKKDTGLKHTKSAAELLRKKGIDFSVDSQISFAFPESPLAEDVKPDVLLVFGGDGTMLSAARKYAPLNVELLGINLGRLGFLLTTEIEQLGTAIDKVLNGDYKREERTILEARNVSADGSLKSISYALNDAVISRARILRMIDLELYINSSYADNYIADGIIVSTPTGSTGYTLSAGGPVVWPTLDVLLITPICPHRLSSKSIVISGDSMVSIVPKPDGEGSVLTLDGQESITLEEGGKVDLVNADFKAVFIRFPDWNFYTLLTEKLSEWNSLRRY